MTDGERVPAGSRPAAANPFRASRLATLRHASSSDDRARLMAAWEAGGRRGGLVGPHGTGKTTLLEALAGDLQARGLRPCWVRLARGVPGGVPRVVPHARPGAADVVLLDGGECLGLIAWWRFALRVRHAAGWLATLHAPRPPLPVLLRTGPDRAVFERLLEELIASLPQEEQRTLSARAAAAWKQHRGNLHAVWRDLYEAWAEGCPPAG